jgi:hypothetical protein
VNLPILDLHDGYASHPNRYLFANVRTEKGQSFVAISVQSPSDAVSTAEDGVGLSLGIPEEFTCVVLLSALIAAKGRIGL